MVGTTAAVASAAAAAMVRTRVFVPVVCCLRLIGPPGRVTVVPRPWPTNGVLSRPSRALTPAPPGRRSAGVGRQDLLQAALLGGDPLDVASAQAAHEAPEVALGV